MYSCIAHSFTNLFSLKFYVLFEVYDNVNLGIISSLLFFTDVNGRSSVQMFHHNRK